MLTEHDEQLLEIIQILMLVVIDDDDDEHTLFDVDTNEYLYFVILQLVDILLHEVQNILVEIIQYTALLLIEL